jgi:IS5 family transposase
MFLAILGTPALSGTPTWSIATDPARHRASLERQQAANTTRSRVRARVEHVFANQENGMGGIFVRTVGMARAAVKIGMMNLVYNMRRFVWLERAAAPG